MEFQISENVRKPGRMDGSRRETTTSTQSNKLKEKTTTTVNSPQSVVLQNNISNDIGTTSSDSVMPFVYLEGAYVMRLTILLFQIFFR